ncbi:hypothetical protein Cch01nite_32560 [Cellulomonas chitinilytica]|uniref:Uncharacterized protein n=1 Tax=Cellulomonas chitinilytica TaxID=398759 RepID=A0A919P5J2_9CELL|nr:hypothetical protein Cch01nite_32560 [Cellulomonas chitinilytica]
MLREEGVERAEPDAGADGDVRGAVRLGRDTLECVDRVEDHLDAVRDGRRGERVAAADGPHSHALGAGAPHGRDEFVQIVRV